MRGIAGNLRSGSCGGMTMGDTAARISAVKEYYGTVLQRTGDLKTGACCTTETLPSYLRKIVGNLDSEIVEKFYGCGSPIPPRLEGCAVLDLGCGTGRDSYVAAYLAGERGRVMGVDMTREQVQIAKNHAESQARRFGFSKPNTIFEQGYIEDLKAIGIEDNTVDVVISNCVVNLSPDKEAVFSEIFRVLKPGGELFFSDVFADRRVPEEFQSDPVLVGECLGGALYFEDFRRILRGIGCLDFRVFSSRKIALNNEEIEAKVGMIGFYSMTIRAFKLDSLEDICEDYGQAAVYSGTLLETPHQFVLDDHHVFEAGKPMLVCGNTASMVQETRYGDCFKVIGDRSVHYGAFPCAPVTAQAEGGVSQGGGTCAC